MRAILLLLAAPSSSLALQLSTTQTRPACAFDGRRAVATAKPVLLTPSRVPEPASMRYLGEGPGGFDVGSLAAPLFIGFLFASGAAWFLFQSFFVLFFIVPLVVAPVFQWYLQNNLLEGTCPQCGAPAQGLKGQSTQCFACGTTMSCEVSESGVFYREGAAAREPGVVDVEIEVD